MPDLLAKLYFSSKKRKIRENSFTGDLTVANKYKSLSFRESRGKF